MGKKKTTDMDAATEVVETKEKKVAKKVAKKKPAKKIEAIEVMTAEAAPETAESDAKAEKKQRVRSKRYTHARGLVDKTRFYSPEDAVALVKKTHYGSFGGSLEVNLVLRGEGVNVDVAFPHATGKTVTVAIATDELLAKIEKGVIDFTVLVAHPSMMPKLSKLARVLGPKGLMPNPKNGTLAPDPEKRKKELESGAVTVKAEKKFPLVHTTLGKLAQPDAELVANMRALMKAYPAGKLVKCSVSGSMGPGIKVKVE